MHCLARYREKLRAQRDLCFKKGFEWYISSVDEIAGCSMMVKKMRKTEPDVNHSLVELKMRVGCRRHLMCFQDSLNS